MPRGAGGRTRCPYLIEQFDWIFTYSRRKRITWAVIVYSVLIILWPIYLARGVVFCGWSLWTSVVRQGEAVDTSAAWVRQSTLRIGLALAPLLYLGIALLINVFL